MKFLAGVHVFFIFKLDGTLEFWVNYCKLNTITMKNQYLFLLIHEILDGLIVTWVFTKIDKKNTYHYFEIQENDK